MKRKAFAAILLSTLVISACSSNQEPSPNTAQNSATQENEVQNIKELVHDYSVGNIPDQSASITSHQLIVRNSDKSELTYELAEDEFFVSIAPYFDQTHP